MPSKIDSPRETLQKWRCSLFKNAYVHYRYAGYLLFVSNTVSAVSISIGVIAFSVSIGKLPIKLWGMDNETWVFTLSLLYLIVASVQAYFKNTEKYFHHKQSGTDSSSLRRRIEKYEATLGQIDLTKEYDPEEIRRFREIYDTIASNSPIVPATRYWWYMKAARKNWVEYNSTE
jgi:hypothetical protein